MKQATPEEVLRAVSLDIKYRGLSREAAAEKIGLGSKQTYSNIIASKKYLTPVNAKRFSQAFGYNEEFLLSGTGELLPDGTPASAFVAPAAKRNEPTAEERYASLNSDWMQVFIWLNSFANYRQDDEALVLLRHIWQYMRAEQDVRAEISKLGLDESEFGTLLQKHKDETAASIEDLIQDCFKKLTGVNEQ